VKCWVIRLPVHSMWKPLLVADIGSLRQ
jgi:hypothetical protein